MATFIERKDYSKKLNIQEQASHICLWLQKNWFVPNELNLEEVVNDLITVSELLFKDMIDGYLFSDIFKYLSNREKLIKDKSILDESNLYSEQYDTLTQILNFITFGYREFSDNTKKVYFNTDYSKVIQYKLKLKYKSINNLLPNGYNEYLKTYEDYQDMENIDPNKEIDAFNGFIFKKSSDIELPIILNIAHIAYNDINQSRKPLDSLIFNITSSFFQIISHNNTVDFFEELNSLDLNQPVLYNFNLSPMDFLNKDLYFIKKIINTKDNKFINIDIQEHKAKLENIKLITEEEKQEKRKKALNDILAVLTSSQEKNKLKEEQRESTVKKSDYNKELYILLDDIFK